MADVFYLSHPKAMSGTKTLTEIGQLIERSYEGVIRFESARAEKYQSRIFFRKMDESNACDYSTA